MDLELTGKRVLVTGGSQGIGKAIALSFAKEGANVSVISRREDVLQQVCTQMGEGHSYFVGDLLEAGVPLNAVQVLEKEGGPFDIVVHNVGGPLEHRSALSSIEAWQKVWQFNVGIAIEMNNHIVPSMQKRGWGRVIHISSISGESLRGRAPYAVSKCALRAYTKTLGREVAKDGVVVSAVLPGAIAYDGSYWDKAKEEAPEKLADFLRHHQAIGRMGTPEEIAAFVLFLSSPHASFATGAMLGIDGGSM